MKIIMSLILSLFTCAAFAQSGHVSDVGWHTKGGRTVCNQKTAGETAINPEAFDLKYQNGEFALSSLIGVFECTASGRYVPTQTKKPQVIAVYKHYGLIAHTTQVFDLTEVNTTHLTGDSKLSYGWMFNFQEKLALRSGATVSKVIFLSFNDKVMPGCLGNRTEGCYFGFPNDGRIIVSFKFSLSQGITELSFQH